MRSAIVDNNDNYLLIMEGAFAGHQDTDEAEALVSPSSGPAGYCPAGQDGGK